MLFIKFTVSKEFLERFIKKGKGQIGKALWGKHVGRYYLYQVRN